MAKYLFRMSGRATHQVLWALNYARSMHREYQMHDGWDESGLSKREIRSVKTMLKALDQAIDDFKQGCSKIFLESQTRRTDNGKSKKTRSAKSAKGRKAGSGDNHATARVGKAGKGRAKQKRFHGAGLKGPARDRKTAKA